MWQIYQDQTKAQWWSHVKDTTTFFHVNQASASGWSPARTVDGFCWYNPDVSGHGPVYFYATGDALAYTEAFYNTHF